MKFDPLTTRESIDSPDSLQVKGSISPGSNCSPQHQTVLATPPTTSVRPFSASGLAHHIWNPFKKKSGILGVIYAQAKRNRVVSKHGKLNTFRRPDETEDNHRYLKDFFISMIDFPWSWTLLGFGASFLLSWLMFATLWYLILILNGDLAGELDRPASHKVCVENMKDFTSCFLFSLETQHTIGYGVRAPTEECTLAIVIISIQSIFGVIIQACMAGIVFAKFTKPTMRAETILFSKNALITLRNGSFYLLCRVADLRPNHLLEAHVSGHMVKRELTQEGEIIPYHLQRMEFGAELDGSQDYFQMFWPTILSHKIDQESPLWDVSPRTLNSSIFEIVLTMEGTTPETGNTIQVRTSYLPNEVLWGYRFEHTCVIYDIKAAKYEVSFNNLNKHIADRTPRCSAKDWEERRVTSASVSSESFICQQIDELTGPHQP
ncbi:inward rectifier potassium channel irk-1 [Eurytemora carolleeae]|uniref:inward rectifier potassium channel irk-1 n=1 Tax=Eurytemora carolleeae TaxID=1294199 RepID=UPI000C75D10C|nr:inward rectifier potassium channel irk-1 [Eurytemora carolleeae]XP_023343764.1 inward rectifier potassium channel irk-1 [Eurytemora carolleeae]XP_023343772.1 inward rectifier potassium channel irk-1 [Eurytemora carolleeae]|eukprot:XP_023343757.1 inward rectifier potassium channel irk-1-like [Eurytemora affinis]